MSIGERPDVLSPEAPQGLPGRRFLAGLSPRGRRYAILLAILLALLAVVILIALWYAWTRKPLTELPEAVGIARSVPPRFLFSIYDVGSPIGVAVSPSGDRVYVSESDGERAVKVFDRDGKLLQSLVPPGSTRLIRSPVYIALDDQGRVYVTDRLQHAIFIYGPDGKYLDSMFSPTLRLRAWAMETGGEQYGQPDLELIYLFGDKHVLARRPDGTVLSPLPTPTYDAWAPLGIAWANGNLYITEVTKGYHRVMVFDRDLKQVLEFGREGTGQGEFSYPNGIALDRQGQIYVTDSNNGRVQVFSPKGEFLELFGSGWALPRGIKIDNQGRVYVVDVLEHKLRVLQTGAADRQLYDVGEEGNDDGKFILPNDVAIDGAGKVYVVDRRNNRLQVWTY